MPFVGFLPFREKQMSSTTAYYDSTAAAYDALHGIEPEHTVALELSWPLLLQISSVLDVGCGTGRSLQWVNNTDPNVTLAGIEPSNGMLELARKSLPKASLTQGSGEHLPYDDDAFDVAIATGIMHHVDDPTAVISEMFRVAKNAVIISDHNNYAFGSDLKRRIRLGLKACGLQKIAAYVLQGFNHKGYSEEDGWWYPYSIFDNYGQIAALSKSLVIMPTRRPQQDLGNILYTQSHVVIVALR